mgnify:CR=1 FL=1
MGFDPEALLALIERERIDTMFMVPTMFVRLLKLPDEVKRRVHAICDAVEALAIVALVASETSPARMPSTVREMDSAVTGVWSPAACAWRPRPPRPPPRPCPPPRPSS